MATWRILVVDDEPYVLLALHEVLAALPASIQEAQDGEEALRLARDEHPDLILLDVKMPDMDGFQVIEKLKQDPATAGIPVVFLSALGGSKEKLRGLELGAEDYLVKPIDGEELKARVRMVLRRAHTKETPHSTVLTHGQLETTSLASLLRSLSGEGRTVRVRLRRDDEEGEIVLLEGRITAAAQGPRRGPAAIYQLLGWQDGTFEMGAVTPSSPMEGEVTEPNQTLLTEASRRQLEIADLRTKLAGVKGPLMVSTAVRAAVESLAAPAALALVALLDGTRALPQLLCDSPFDDWATLRLLHRLNTVGALESVHVEADRRTGLRLKVGLPIEYQSVGLWQQSSTFNLSPWGVFIRTPVPYAVGEEVMLRFRLPDREEGISVLGRVIWANPDPTLWGGTGMGIQFADLPLVERKAIEEHLAQTIASQLAAAAERPA